MDDRVGWGKRAMGEGVGGWGGSTEVDLVVVVVECGCSWVAALRPSNMLVYLGTDLLRQLCVLPY